METGTTEKGVEAKTTYSVISYAGPELPEMYRNMILAKWLRTLRFGNDFFRLVDSLSYFSSYQKYIKALLAKPDCVVRLAVLTDERDTCLGFSVGRTDILDYVWSHKDNRKIGVAKSLVQFPFSAVTHLTTTGMVIWSKKFPAAVFDPFR